jgi:hypothetical protein
MTLLRFRRNREEKWKTMRFLLLSLVYSVLLCCSVPVEEKPSPESAAVKIAAAQKQGDAEGSLAEGKGVDTADRGGDWGAIFNSATATDSMRLEAAEHLLQIDSKLLAVLYRSRDHVPFLRAFIEEKVQRQDESVLPLLLQLFVEVGSEERIDFEHYILAFGRSAEADLYPLLHANNRSIALRAMDTLAKMRSAPAADSIAKFLTHESNWMRMSAAHAVGEIGADGAAALLVQTLADTAYPVVNAALVGLGRLKAVEAYGEIAGLLTDPNKHVRKHAAMALGELGDRRALEKVRQLAVGDADAGVRFMAAKAVEKLEKAR